LPEKDRPSLRARLGYRIWIFLSRRRPPGSPISFKR